MMNRHTSITLGKHFDEFIHAQLNSGRFSSISEIVRAGLRLLEENETRLTTLRERLTMSEEQANRKEFAHYSLEHLID